ncbi:MAG: hypothetical protein COZ12_00575, partial [Deltaproteobacteria bacterium CG_4_10_14_3_um_filter_60_8]
NLRSKKLTMTPARPGRIASIDFCRVIAVFAVIMIHTKPFMRDLFPSAGWRLPEYIFNQPARFAVPFFFMVAGYFLGKTLAAKDRWAKVARYERRLLVLLVAWSILYTLIPSFWPHLQQMGYQQLTFAKIQQLLAAPLHLIFQGAKVHLWFLPALMLGVLLLALCVQGGRTLPAVVVAVLLFVFGLLGGSYSVTPIGFHVPFSTRDGPFVSMICLTIGYLFQTKKTVCSPVQALLVSAAGLLLQVLETWMLWKYFEVPWLAHDFLIGTVLTAAGLLLFALAAPNLGRRSKLESLGKYTLGVYACHYLFVDALGPLTYLFELHIWQLLFPLLVYLLSVALTGVLARQPWLKALVA